MQKAIEPYVFLNEHLMPASEVSIQFNNRAFRYGDGFFETIRCFGTHISFFEAHYARIHRALEVCKMLPSDNLKENILRTRISQLINRHKLFKSSRIRIQVFRNNGGLYTPEDNTVSVVIEASEIQDKLYEMNHNGYIIDLFKDMQKFPSALGFFKHSSAGLFVMAGIYAKENKLNEAVILNNEAKLCETTASNLFIVKENHLLTPPLSDGCVDGIMRGQILKLASENGMSIDDTNSLTPNIFHEADEVFLTNAIKGIQWVLGYQKKRFYKTISRELISLLNKKIFDKI